MKRVLRSLAALSIDAGRGCARQRCKKEAPPVAYQACRWSGATSWSRLKLPAPCSPTPRSR